LKTVCKTNDGNYNTGYKNIVPLQLKKLYIFLSWL